MRRALAVAGLLALLGAIPADAGQGSGGRGGYSSGLGRGGSGGRGWGGHGGRYGTVSSPICSPGTLEELPDGPYRHLYWDGALVGMPGWRCVGPRPEPEPAGG